MKTFKSIFTALGLFICTLCSLNGYADNPFVLDLQNVSTTQNEDVIQYHILVENSEALILNFDAGEAADIITITSQEQTIDVLLEIEDPFAIDNTIRVTDDVGVETIYVLPQIVEDNTDDKPTMIVQTGVLEVADSNL